MSIKYLFGDTTNDSLEDWDKKAKEEFFQEYETYYPNNKYDVIPNFLDKITGITADTLVKYAIDGETIHTYRLTSMTLHPTDSNKFIIPFDDAKENDKLNLAYYATQTWRDNNLVGQSFSIINKSEAESAGFIFFNK